MPRSRPVVGTLWSGVARLAAIRHGRRPADLEPVECLRRRHFVQQMTIDVDQARAVVAFHHQVIAPDLVVQRFSATRRVLESKAGHGRIALRIRQIHYFYKIELRWNGMN